MSSLHSTSIFKFFSCLLVFCSLILHGAQAGRIPSRRYTTTFTAPSGYRFSWGIDNERLSYGTQTGFYLSRTALKGSNIGQSQINSCASLCETTMKCGFFHPVEMKGSSDGNVMCALYSSKVGKANATFSSGSGTTPGKVTFSYGFTRDAGSVSQVPQSSGSGTKTAGGASSGFSTSTRSTSTTSSTKSSSTTSSTAARTTSSSTSSRSSTTSTKSTSTSSRTTSSSSTTSTAATSTSTFVSPSGYSSSWEINSRRLSYGASTGAYLSRTTLSGEVLGQDQIDECSQNCESSKGCAFFHPILFNNSSDGNVVCSLYNATVTRDKATFSSGTGSTPGTVVRSYAYKRNDGPVITVATPTSSFAYPPSPTGATFVNHQPCEGTRARVPMFVNKAWSNGSVSLASKAFIITHGAGRDFDQAWRDTYPLIGDNDVLVAPVFYLQSDTPTYSNTTGRQSNWFTVNSTLAWSSTIETAGGSDAIYPASGQFSAIGASCSTFTVYDSLISLFGDKSKYPLLQQVNVIGHSNGAGTSARYSIVAPPPPSGVSLRFSFANTPTFPFFTNDRPWAYTSDQTAAISSWMYGFDSNLSPYVARRMTDLPTMFSNWAAQDVRTITGDLDTFSRYNFGDASPPAMVQGGDRRDRNYAFWAYRNLLAGTSTDVSAYYGYGNLTTLNGGVQSLNVPTFNHQNCVVDGVGHVGSQMWASDCGRAALFDSTLPAGSPPLRP